MAIDFILSDRAKTQAIDLTATPQAVFTNSSTYTIASLVAAVTAEEISGNGYSRPTLSVASNTLNVDGVGVITYANFSVTASGGNITFDRIALIADSDWVGWLDTGATTITDGTSKTYSIVYGRGSSGVALTGSDGRNAYTISTANFTQPAAAASVAIAVENSNWLAAGAIFFFTDGTNSGHYQVVSIDSATAITATNLNYTGDATAATTMLSGGSLVASGRDGADGLGWTSGSYDAGTGIVTFTSTDGLGFVTGDLRGATGATGADGITGFGLRFTFSATTTGPAGAGELRFNNASPGSATEIYIDAEDRNALDVSAISSDLNPGSSILVLDESDAAVWALFTLNSVTDNGTDLTLGVTAVGAAGTFAGDVSLAFANKGNVGPTGATGAAGLDGADGLTGFGLRFTFSATTTGPAGAGELRFNNASPGSATNIFIDAEDRNALDVSAITSALNAGSSILVLDESDPAVWALFTLSSVTDNGTDLTLVVTAVGANGTFAGDVSLTFANKGDVGATGAGGIAPSSSIFTTNQTGVDGELTRLDASSSDLTFTLPATPSAGNRVGFVITAISASYSVSVDRNGSNIEGGTDTFPWRGLLVGDSVTFLYVGGSAGWIIESDGLSPILADVELSTSTAMTNLTWTKVPLDTIVRGTNLITVSSGAITPRRGGNYKVSINVGFAPTGLSTTSYAGASTTLNDGGTYSSSIAIATTISRPNAVDIFDRAITGSTTIPDTQHVSLWAYRPTGNVRGRNEGDLRCFLILEEVR